MEDLKILDAYVHQYFTDDILSHKWKPFGLALNLPSSNQYQEYLNTLKMLPKDDPPSIFGLPENTERAWEQETAAKTILGLKDLNGTKNIPLKFDKEKFQKGLAPFIAFWKKLNQGQSFLAMTDEVINAHSSAVQIFILEEFNYGLNLLRSIHRSFAILNRICKGSISPQEKDIMLATVLMNHETPEDWIKVWNGPKDPTLYLRTITQKMSGLIIWKNGDINNLLRQPINLSIYFHPEAFLISHKQDFSRLNKYSTEKLTLKTSWKSSANYSLTLNGILIEGAILETVIKHCPANSDNITSAPHCYLQWILKEKDDANHSIRVPFYATSKRCLKIADLEVPGNKEDEAQWIAAGLAFYADY